MVVVTNAACALASLSTVFLFSNNGIEMPITKPLAETLLPEALRLVA